MFDFFVVQVGAFFQSLILSIKFFTPSKISISGFHPIFFLINDVSARVMSGSPCLLGI